METDFALWQKELMNQSISELLYEMEAKEENREIPYFDVYSEAEWRKLYDQEEE